MECGTNRYYKYKERRIFTDDVKNGKGEKAMDLFYECAKLSEKEKQQIINTGVFNDIIEAYARIAMKEAGMKIEEIKKVNVRAIINDMTALEALEKSNKMNQIVQKNRLEYL